MKVRIGVMISLILIAGLAIGILTIRNSNERKLEETLSHPEEVFHGTYSTNKVVGPLNDAANGTELCVYFANDRPDYDEKNLVFADEKKGTGQGFNTYYIKPGRDDFYDEKTKEQKTTWFLCKYDGVNSILLLDKNNNLAGRIAVMPGEADWLGRVELNYYWIKEEKVVQIFKREEYPYSGGTSYLESKYYSGKF